MISIAPLILYAFAFAMISPNISLLALDCFPHNRGSTAAVQGAIQMLANALLASVIAPFVGNEAVNFVWIQAIAFFFALLLWGYIHTLNRN